MIGTAEPTRVSRGQLLTSGLPLQDPMPLQLPLPSGAEVRQDGPLALDYRTWSTDLPMASDRDVSYTQTYREYYYDSKAYYRWIYDGVDDK